MAQTKEKPETAVAVKEEAIVLVGGKQVDINELTKNLKGMKAGLDITGDFYEWEEGEELNCYVVGVQMINGKDQTDIDDMTGQPRQVPAIRVLTEDNKIALFADKVLRGNLLEVAKSGIPTPYRISCTGEEKSGKGKYKTFSIKPLFS